MAINYAQIAVDAAAAIATAGQSVTLKYEADEVINKATGAITTPASDTSVVCNGVFLKYNSQEIDGENILIDDAKLIIETVATEPDIGWTATVNSVEYQVVGVSPLEPAGTNVIYTLQLRK